MAALQIGQCGKELDAFQIRNLFGEASHLLYRVPLHLREDAVMVAVILVGDEGPEVGVGEIGLVDGYVSPGVRSGGGGGEGRRDQAADQGQGQQQGKESIQTFH